MTEKEQFFLLIMLTNLGLVILYLIWKAIRRDEPRGSCLMKAGVMLLCPLAGPGFLILHWLLFKVLRSQEENLDDVIFSKEKVQAAQHPDEERERNLVSLEEALTITDTDNLRRLMMNLIKGDYRNMLAEISLALDSDDSETAHYAAVVLQSVLNEFRVKVQEKFRLCTEEGEGQAEACMDLLIYMDDVLKQRVFTDMEQASMVSVMAQAGEILYKLNPQAVSSENFERISMRLLEVEDFEKCGKWCERALEQYPMTLSSYSCYLKYTFSVGDRDKFFELMSRLRSADIRVDAETLELIRTFM